MESTAAICSVAACTRPARRRGLCNGHYARLRISGGVQAEKPLHPGGGHPLGAETHAADLLAFAALVVEAGPTTREFVAARGFSSSSVAAYHLAALKRLGCIARRDEPGGGISARPWVLTGKGRDLLRDLRSEHEASPRGQEASGDQ